MTVMRYFPVFVAMALSCLAFSSSAMADDDIEALINQLADTSNIGFGYSAQFSGNQFLPYPDSSEVGTLVLGSPAPEKSETLEAIVKAGSRAVPLLLKHMDDARETKIPPVHGMEWAESPDEYDFNRRTRTDPPKGVNQKHGDDPGAEGHTITVGDLCFVALGQIVNRHFNATRYQPSGGLMINSPTSSKALCDVVRDDFKDFTAEKHRQLLLQDFAKPDYEDRRVGATLRLSYYYPDQAEAPVLKQLSVPSYDVFKIEALVRQELYPENSSQKRKEKLDAFIKSNGPASSDGIMTQLFEDLDTQEADEQHRLSPPLSQKYDARTALIQLYGYQPDVKSRDKPYIRRWQSGDEARFIHALVHTKSAKIDAVVHEILLKTGDDDHLAIECIHLLAGKGYDNELVDYCRQRINKGNPYDKEFNQLLSSLDPTLNNSGNDAR